MSGKFMILPIETKARELPGKSLLAAHAAEAGFEVLLGDQRQIARSIHRLPPGIYLDKSVTRSKTLHYHRLKELGHLVAAWCEEGLVYRDKTAYQFERLSPASMNLVDAFFAWGDVHRSDVIEAIPEARDKVHALGNPRFDLLRQPYPAMLDAEAKRLKAEHGRFILVVTTFSRFNRHQGQRDVLDVLEARGFKINPEQEAYYSRLVDHVGLVYEAFQAMIPVVARSFSDHTIIVRPHPSEDHDRWRKAVTGFENVKVNYQGSVEPWLCAADAVVHNASTIGVEAFLLNRPVFSYMPVVDEVFNRKTHLPNLVSTQVHTVEDLLLAVGAAFDGRSAAPGKNDKLEMVGRYIANASGPLAVERIVQFLSDLHKAHPPAKTDRFSYLNAWSLLTARQSLSRLLRIVRFDPNLHAYMTQKFPGLSLREVEDTFRAISQAAGHADFAIAAHPDLSDCYMISVPAHSEIRKGGSLQREPAVIA